MWVYEYSCNRKTLHGTKDLKNKGIIWKWNFNYKVELCRKHFQGKSASFWDFTQRYDANSIPTSRDKLSAPSWRFKQSKKIFLDCNYRVELCRKHFQGKSASFWDFTQRYNANSIPTSRDKLSVPSWRVKQFKKISLDCLTLEDRSHRLSQKFGTDFPLRAA